MEIDENSKIYFVLLHYIINWFLMNNIVHILKESMNTFGSRTEAFVQAYGGIEVVNRSVNIA
jgi:hypothetical protein